MLKVMIPLLCFVAIFADAEPASMYDLSPVQEVRFQKLLKEFRCLVCQNQSLAESNASLAGDLKNEILRMVREDTPDQAIYTFMTERYGDFVLYRPPFKPATALLWAMPLLLFLAAISGVLIYITRRLKRNKGNGG